MKGHPCIEKNVSGIPYMQVSKIHNIQTKINKVHAKQSHQVNWNLLWRASTTISFLSALGCFRWRFPTSCAAISGFCLQSLSCSSSTFVFGRSLIIGICRHVSSRHHTYIFAWNCFTNVYTFTFTNYMYIYQSLILLKRERDELVLKTQPLRFFGSSDPPVSTINETTLQSRRGEKKSAKPWEAFRDLPRFSFDRNLDNVLLLRHHGDQGLVTPFQGITPWQGSGFCWTEPGHPSRSRTRCYGNAKKNHESNLWCGYLSKIFWGRNGLQYVKHLWLEYLSLFCYPDKICFESYGQFPSHLQRYTYTLQLSLSYHVNRSRPLDHT